MFWRFGFHNTSAIQGIIEKDDATLASIIGEEELLQELKNQNQKLLDLYHFSNQYNEARESKILIWIHQRFPRIR